MATCISEACRAAGVELAVAALPPEAKDVDAALSSIKQDERPIALLSWIEAAKPLAVEHADGEGGAPQEERKRPTATAPGGWGPVVGFEDETPAPFPLAALAVAPWLCEFVGEVSRFAQAPPELAALPALTVIGAAGARVYKVEARAGGFAEPVNIWTAVVLPPGARKSSVFGDVLRPVMDAQTMLAEAEAPKIAREKSRQSILEKRLKDKQGKAAKAPPEELSFLIDEAAEIQAELDAVKDNLESPRLLGADANQEGIAKRMAAAGGRFLVAEPEGTALEVLAGRFADGAPAFENVLKAHDGDPISVDRQSRSLTIPRPALSMAFGVQPHVLEGLAEKKAFRGRGFWGRFLFALPISTIGKRRAFVEEVPKEVLDRFASEVRRLFMQPIPDKERILTPEPEAAAAWEAFFREIEPRQGAGGDLEAIQDWSSKLSGRVLRLAGVLHLAAHGTGADGEPLKVETMEAAIHLGNYFLDHARRTFRAMGADPAHEDARHLWRWIRSREEASVPFRGAWQGLKGRFSNVEQLAAAFGELVDRGHLKENDAERPVTGRPPRPVYSVNPAAFET